VLLHTRGRGIKLTQQAFPISKLQALCYNGQELNSLSNPKTPSPAATQWAGIKFTQLSETDKELYPLQAKYNNAPELINSTNHNGQEFMFL
jgi:hypothetical protein